MARDSCSDTLSRCGKNGEGKHVLLPTDLKHARSGVAMTRSGNSRSGELWAITTSERTGLQWRTRSKERGEEGGRRLETERVVGGG